MVVLIIPCMGSILLMVVFQVRRGELLAQITLTLLGMQLIRSTLYLGRELEVVVSSAYKSGKSTMDGNKDMLQAMREYRVGLIRTLGPLLVITLVDIVIKFASFSYPTAVRIDFTMTYFIPLHLQVASVFVLMSTVRPPKGELRSRLRSMSSNFRSGGQLSGVAPAPTATITSGVISAESVSSESHIPDSSS
mmetsp:Transcript_7307/g.23358  ORF Transcript_7307/g.23358 Transcript_7307/m.23358 type:complete len:192 (+) Transcript_7307:3-578(+)